MIAFILLSLLSIPSLQQTDSIDYQWLAHEWNQTYVTPMQEWKEPGQIYLISLDDGVIHRYTKGVAKGQPEAVTTALRQADYLFTLEGDDYYLINPATLVAQPAKTCL